MNKTVIGFTLALGFISLCATEALAADGAAPSTSVTAPVNSIVYKASTVPSQFTGTVNDNPGSAVGVNANSTTFTLQRGSDSKYWNGSTATWQTTSTNQPTTRAATSNNSSVNWTNSATLPT